MYDLHSHVLPCIDDGSNSEEMTLDMLRKAKEQGVNLVAATPHCFAKSQEDIDVLVEKRNAQYDRIRQIISGYEEFPEIITGSEVLLCKDISEFDNLQHLCYENTNYIMLELPGDNMPSQIAEWVYNICIKGFRPVIAHIDRYSFYKEIMSELSHLDVVYQVNASRFLTMSDRHHLKNIFKLHNKFFVSSDMHNLSSRTNRMGEARCIAEKKFSSKCSVLFNDGAEAILKNMPFPELN